MTQILRVMNVFTVYVQNMTVMIKSTQEAVSPQTLFQRKPAVDICISKRCCFHSDLREISSKCVPDCYNKHKHRHKLQCQIQPHSLWWNPSCRDSSVGKSLFHTCVICYNDFFTGPNSSVCQEMDEYEPLFLHLKRWAASLVSGWLLGAPVHTGPHPFYLLYWPFIPARLERKKEKKATISCRSGQNKGPGGCCIVFISLVN